MYKESRLHFQSASGPSLDTGDGCPVIQLNTTGPSDEAPPLTHRPPPLDDPMTSTSRGASYVESIILLIVSAFYAIQAADNTMSSHWLNATRSDPIMDHSRRADYPASFLNIPKFKV